MDMNNLFSNLTDGAQELNSAAPKSSKTKEETKEERSQRAKEMKNNFVETLKADPTYKERMGRWSDNIEVVNTLGFGEGNNIIVDKTQPPVMGKNGKMRSPLIPTSAIVGYRIQNVGTEPIPYKTEVYSQDEEGVYVGSLVNRTLAPGEAVDLSRMCMTMLCCTPEVSMTLKNGKIVRSSSINKDPSDIRKELESYYFQFNKDENGVEKTVHDDNVKLNVGEKIDGKWVVKADYVETFGYLNNVKAAKKSSRRESKNEFTAQDIAAAWVMNQLREAGLAE